MANLIVKQNDTYPPVVATLTDSNGAINLTTATGVVVRFRGNTTNTIITGACVVTTAASGIVTYNWAVGDTATVDVYQAEFVITWSGGGIQTVPNAAVSNVVVEIDAHL